MKTKFTYNDVVIIKANHTGHATDSTSAWIVGVFEKRPAGDHFKKFPAGVVYSVEFEDGNTTEVHESDLEFSDLISGSPFP